MSTNCPLYVLFRSFFLVSLSTCWSYTPVWLQTVVFNCHWACLALWTGFYAVSPELNISYENRRRRRIRPEFALGGPGSEWFWMECLLTFNHHPWHPGAKKISKPPSNAPWGGGQSPGSHHSCAVWTRRSHSASANQGFSAWPATPEVIGRTRGLPQVGFEMSEPALPWEESIWQSPDCSLVHLFLRVDRPGRLCPGSGGVQGWLGVAESGAFWGPCPCSADICIRSGL